MMKLYHGSDIEVSRPLVNIGRKELDFGPGFYVTSLYEQSIKWARRVSVVRNVVPPIVNVYSFDLDRCLSDHYRRLSLPHYDRQWLDFVVASRRGEQLSNIHSIGKDLTMQDQVLWRKTARIIGLIQQRLDVSVERALDLFYNSRTFSLLNNPDSGLQLLSDQYILEDFCREMEKLQ